MLPRLLICCIAVLLASCSGGPPPKQFILEPVLDPVNESDPPMIDAVALAEVMIPAYAADQRLASRDEQFQIIYDENIKWADSPDEALTRVLANRLRYYLEANVIVEPWPRGYEPQARIEVQFDKILREATGGAEMSGQIRLISGDGKTMIDVRTFQFVRYANSRDPNAFFAAAAAGVNDISRMATDALHDHFSK